jgi:hypothetical protein
MLTRLAQRKNRFIRSDNIAFAILPLVLLPLLPQIWLLNTHHAWFIDHRDTIMSLDILYIVLARLLLLDTAIYIFSHTRRYFHIALLHVVLLYLEVTVITIFFYAAIFWFFEPFHLFHLNSKLAPENLNIIRSHDFILSMYISAVTFTTLGSGDWIPKTLPAMIAVITEVILGVVQGGVFVAILLYAHQNREIE